MSSTSETNVIRDDSRTSTPTAHANHVAYRASISVIVPSGKVVDTAISDSDAFEIVFGESIDLASRAVRFWTPLPLESRQVILQFDWPGRGPVMLDVRLTPAPSRDGRNVYEGEIREVL